MVTLHVTRLKPNTKPNELKKFLEKSLPDIQCEPHTSKRPDIYSSMRITIKREDFKNAWRREVWPNGLFFCPEEDATHSTDGSSPTRIHPNKCQDTTQLEEL
ncbi:hypothetical protein JTB14_036391 [Gonioctena quinquepunctata]|nr:hypothetical protein JTB14_036391 [Gonioctena quinquepunctata]